MPTDFFRTEIGNSNCHIQGESSASRNQATHLSAGSSGFVVAKLAYKWKVMLTIVFGISMIVLDSTVVNVAFPTLRREFDVGLDKAQWIISIYVLALGIATPLAGVLADRFKLKRVYILGLCIFLLGSLVSGFAPSFWLLVGARALQGIGGGIALPLSTVMLFTIFEDEKPQDRIEEKTIEPAKRAEA